MCNMKSTEMDVVAVVPSKGNEAFDRTATQHTGEVDALYDPEAEINYKTMSWWHVGVVRITTPTHIPDTH